MWSVERDKKEEEKKEERQGRDKKKGEGEAIKQILQAQLCPRLLPTSH